jgi:MYXO-CTERM domain-containing protein
LRSSTPSTLASLLAFASAILAAPSALAVQSPLRAARNVASASIGPVVSSGGLEAAPGQPALPAEIAATWGAPPPSRRAAWARFERLHGAGWQALWDRTTGAPLRVLGRGLPAPGSVASAPTAAAQARAFLAEHLDLLAPGLSVEHFVLVTNDLDAGLRTVAFEQRAAVFGSAPVPVVGGRFNVRFKNDRLFVFASEAIADSAVLSPPRIAGAAAELTARAWIAELHGVTALAEGASLVALPLASDGRTSLRLAYRVVIEAGAPRARYAVFVDALRGVPLAREQLLRFAASEVMFDAPERAPQLGRRAYPAPLLSLAVDGAPGESDLAGSFTWPSGDPAALTFSVTGARVLVASASSATVEAAFSAVDSQPVLWSLAEDEQGDAQLSAYIHANIVKQHAAQIAPAMNFLAGTLPAIVNEEDPQGCNAFWNGSSLNFLTANGACNNTARLADVVYHEFGHAFHQHSILTGVGALEASLGEGTGDIMSASVTHDPRLAPGFFLTGDTSLRDMDTGRRWPEDISDWDPHETGLIWAGAMWDLRTFLVSDLGAAAGHALTDQLFYQAIRRSSSIPTTYAEVLAADDDDGDLSNGTPHVCAINRAFLAHGLAPLLDEAGRVVHHDPLSVVASSAASYPIDVTTEVLYPQCATAGLDSVQVVVRVGGVTSKVALTPGPDGHYTGALPSRPADTQFTYQVRAQEGSASFTLPDNRADDEYRVFVGETRVLYENDFETAIDGWTFGDTKGTSGDFQWGPPKGLGGDPAAAFSGSKVIGNRLDGTGLYKAGRTLFADSPVIDLQGEDRVRLQVRRWLTVQDGVDDQASIYVNGQLLWQNSATSEEDGTLDHRDLEWRFEDIDLRPYLQGATTAQIRFEIAADGSTQRGGFTLDDFRIVAFKPPPTPPVVDPPPPDPPVDETPPPVVPPSGCDCSSAAPSPSAPRLTLAALGALGLILARRRRR